MDEARRYRLSAVDCLKVAQDCGRPIAVRKVYLSMAGAWLSLARQDEALAENEPVTPAP